MDSYSALINPYQSTSGVLSFIDFAIAVLIMTHRVIIRERSILLLENPAQSMLLVQTQFNGRRLLLLFTNL